MTRRDWRGFPRAFEPVATGSRGTLKVGTLADLIVVAGNPLEDLSAFADDRAEEVAKLFSRFRPWARFGSWDERYLPAGPAAPAGLAFEEVFERKVI